MDLVDLVDLVDMKYHDQLLILRIPTWEPQKKCPGLAIPQQGPGKSRQFPALLRFFPVLLRFFPALLGVDSGQQQFFGIQA